MFLPTALMGFPVAALKGSKTKVDISSIVPKAHSEPTGLLSLS